MECQARWRFMSGGLPGASIREDAAQREAVGLLDELHGRLLREFFRAFSYTAFSRRLKARLSSLLPSRTSMRRQDADTQTDARQPRGLYLWGGVGRGKTLLMDIFHESLPGDGQADGQTGGKVGGKFGGRADGKAGGKAGGRADGKAGGKKLRLHFHRFMREVHHQLRQHQGVANPLKKVAATFADRARVICLDEFHVSDITDAMLLAGLLDEMFRLGLVLVATSNTAPDDLYRDGLQRSKFLPAIELLKEHMRVHHVDGEVDHRLRMLSRAKIYHWPLDAAAEDGLGGTLAGLSPDARERVELMIEGRPILTRWCGDGVVWFDFAALCDGPRSQNDYIEIARLFQTVLLGKVPVFGGSDPGGEQVRGGGRSGEAVHRSGG